MLHTRIENRANPNDRWVIEGLYPIIDRMDVLGVFNRRYFDERLSEEGERCSRGGPLSLLMIDVDLFKPLNDSLGHQAGDACLKALASAISESINRGAGAIRSGTGIAPATVPERNPRHIMPERLHY